MSSNAPQHPESVSEPLPQSAARPLPILLLAHFGILISVCAYASHRYSAMQNEKLPPVPSVKPFTLTLERDHPEVVTDEQLQQVLHKLRPRLRGPKPPINHVDHALRFWGIEAEFADEDCLSGLDLRGLLTDHRQYREAWGDESNPFLLPATAGNRAHISFRTKSGSATASHYDHTLAGLAEVGTPLDYPIMTPQGELPLEAALNFSLDNFRINQGEYEWSVLVFLHYLYDTPVWFNSEGQRITWDALADRLMRQRLAKGVCYGNHRLYTLALLLRVDEQHHLLSDDGRNRVEAYLQDVTQRLIDGQHADGYWDGKWPGEEWDGPQPSKVEGPLGVKGDRLLATGHTLEWWAIAPETVGPPEAVAAKAGQWIVAEIDSLTDREVTTYYTFLTHAGRSLSLWRGKFPAESYKPAIAEPARDAD